MNLKHNSSHQSIPFGRRFVFVLVLCFVSLIFLEFSALIWEHFFPRNTVTPEKYPKHALLSNTEKNFLTDQIKRLATSPKDIVSIVCLGDSVTYGFRMPRKDSYPSQLQSMLNQRGYPVRVINAGQVGASLLQGIQTYFEKIRQYHPDIIIAGFGINDHFFNPTPDSKYIRLPESMTLSIQHFLRYSALYRTMKRFLKPDQPAGSLDSVRVSPSEFRSYLKKFISLLREDRVKLILMNELSANFDLVLISYGNIMKDIASAEEIPMIDLYEKFPDFAGRPIAFSGSPYQLDKARIIRHVIPIKITNTALSDLFIDAYHPNARGYKILARIVAEEIEPFLETP